MTLTTMIHLPLKQAKTVLKPVFLNKLNTLLFCGYFPQVVGALAMEGGSGHGPLFPGQLALPSLKI